MFIDKQKFAAKAGVSLITVLLFMLIATIAATATWKWITSEGKSSTSRMLQREAYQSSIAGIENARAWMTFHGNDLGGIVGQYFENQKRPVSLNSVLKPLAKAGQNYDVWLTGVNTENNVYKLQILSSGEARNGTRHSEVAILNVTGLYQVKVPSEQVDVDINLKDALFGSLASAGDLLVSSATINGSPSATNGGGAAFSNVSVSDYLIVTGTAEFNSSTTVKDLYVVDGFSACANVTVNGNAYIGDKLYALAASAEFTVHGDLLANKGVDLTQKPNTMGGCSGAIGGMYQIDGNLTSNGNFIAYNQNVENSFTVNGNLIVNGSMRFPSISEVDVSSLDDWTNSFEFKENAYIKNGFSGSLIDYSKAANLKFSDSDADIYIPDLQRFTYSSGATLYENYWKIQGFNFPKTGVGNTYASCPYTYPYCYSTAYSFNYYNYNHVFTQIQGDVYSYSSPSSTKLEEWSANPMTEYSSKISDEGEENGCATENYVPDPIQFNTNILSFDKVHKSTNKLGCSEKIWSQWPSDWSGAINACYSTASTNDLYQDKWLVVELEAPIYIASNEVSTPLNGYFIFIIKNGNEQPDNTWLTLPAMTASSEAMIYFPDGWNQMSFYNGASTSNNYFIFSAGDIKDFQMGTAPMNGTVFMSNCSSLNTATHNASVNITFSESLTNDLAASAVICNKSSSTGCTVPSTTSTTDDESSGTTASTTTTTSGYDTYHISTAPQLGISLESQHATTESNPVTDSFDPIVSSIVVLPRVIYLPRDPVGKLTDYYNVINLNGATEVKENSKVSCSSGEINTTGALYQDGNKITEGIYTCTYKSNQYGDMPFYIVVSGTSGTDPQIHFVEDNTEVTAGGSAEVQLYVPQSSHGQFEVDVTLSSIPDYWHVTPGAGVSLREGNTYKVTATPSSSGPSTITIFNVSVDNGAENNGILFSLVTPCNGCIISNPSTDYVYMSGIASVTRGTLTDYCTSNVDECSANGYDTKKELPNCDDLVSGEWVKATGLNCQTTDLNNAWTCGTNTAITLQGASDVPSYCELIIPSENNRVSNPEDGEPYTLYADLKRKAYNFTVEKDGSTSSDSKLKVYISSGGAFNSTPNETCSDNSCTYTVYAGYSVKVEYVVGSGDEFSYWTCTGTNCPSSNYVPTATYTVSQITSDNTVTANFNDVDRHCFYEDFNGIGSFCTSGQTHCIANCSVSHCSVSDQTAEDWQLIYKNGGKGNGKPNIAPTVGNGSITGGDGSNKDNSAGGQTLILSPKQAGANGTMSAFVTIPISTKNKNATVNEFLNSGLIFRSNNNASDYSILNLYGISDGTLRIRVCKENDQGTQNANGGCLTDEFNNLKVYSNSNMASVRVVLDDNTLTATVEINGVTETIVLDISGYSNTSNQYVGMKLSDPAFVMYDIGWQSSSFPNEGCWDIPTINCSFKANYLGGIVPLNTDATPWVSLSSWFTDNGCTEEYYYNGNDNISSQVSDDTYGYKLSSSTYKFSAEGMHGPENKDAKVSASCPTSLNTSVDNSVVSCGNFWVGEKLHCQDNLDLFNDDHYATANEDLVIHISNDGLNIREATLFIQIADLTVEKQVTIRLKDVNGTYSLPTTVTSNTTHSMSVDIMSNSDGFDPQHVTDIVLLSDVSFTVKAARTTCPYALSITDCEATYNGTSWVITSTINNIDGAAENGCSVTPDDNNITGLSEVACPQDGKFTLTDANFYSRLNSGTSSQENTFTITAKKDQSEETVSCEAQVTYSPITITCEIASESAVQGTGVPTLTYSIANCPSSGCPYTLSLSTSPATTAEGTQTGSSDTWTPSVNTATALATSNYTYTITSMGKEQNCGTFTVNEASPASVTSCSISEGVFTASITPANDGTQWSATFAAADANGNIIEGTTSSSSGDGNTATYTIPNISQQTTDATYYVIMTLNGNTVEDCSPTWTVTGSGGGTNTDDLSLTDCPTSVEGTTTTTFTPTVAGCSGGSTCTWSINNDATVSEGSNGQLTISGASAGTDYTLTLTRGTSTDDDYATATCDISFTAATPTFSVQCNSGEGNTIADQTNVTQGATVEITPYQVSGCNSDCSYDIKIGETSVLPSIPTTYNGGEISFTGANSSGEKDYTLTIYDPTSSSSQSCTFSVTYAEASTSEGCHCATYCGSGCDNLQIGFNVGFEGTNTSKKCFFGTSIKTVNRNYDKYDIKVNGINIGFCDNASNCATALTNAGVTTVDGGYYMEIGISSEWIKGTVTGATTNPCTGESIGSGTEASPYNIGSITNSANINTFIANTWYSATVSKDGGGRFVIQNHTNVEATLTYKDCSGTQKTATIKKGQEGNDGDGWWNKVEQSVAKDCEIVFKLNNDGDYDLQVW